MLRGASLILAAFACAGADAPVRFGCVEVSFTASKDFANPLAEEIAVEFTGPEDETARVQAFWDGARNWKARFSPESTGEWSYTVLAEGFTPASGRVRVSGYRGRNELYRRGAPEVSSNGRYFVHADGTPWFWLGDTAWNGALLSTDEEWEKYLTRRAADKFTLTQVVMTQWRAGKADELGQLAFTGAEKIEVNPAFFQRMDRKIRAANEHGMVAGLVALWALTSKERESPGEALPDDQAALLARYIVSRYDAYAVMWLLGGDGDYRGAKAERWKRIGRAAFLATMHHRPVTLHPRGMQDPWADLKDEPWLDFLMYQSGHGDNAKKWEWNAKHGPADGWLLDPSRPVVDGEINYERHVSYQSKALIGEAQVRRAAYYSLLAAPPAGVTYGAHGMWFWSRKAEVPLNHPSTGVAEPWFECLDYPGAKQMKVLREIFDSLEWWRLRPARSILAEEPADPEFRNYPMPALADDGSFALIYLPARVPLKLSDTRLVGRPRGTWIDPRTGKRQAAGRGLEFQPPGEGDWLLLLQGVTFQPGRSRIRIGLLGGSDDRQVRRTLRGSRSGSWTFPL